MMATEIIVSWRAFYNIKYNTWVFYHIRAISCQTAIPQLEAVGTDGSNTFYACAGTLEWPLPAETLRLTISSARCINKTPLKAPERPGLRLVDPCYTVLPERWCRHGCRSWLGHSTSRLLLDTRMIFLTVNWKEFVMSIHSAANELVECQVLTRYCFTRKRYAR